MNFLIAPCPHVTSEEYFQYSRVCITSDSDSVYVWHLVSHVLVCFHAATIFIIS